MSTTPDKIELSINTNAPAERVYDLVSRAGWWLYDRAITVNAVAVDGVLTTVSHPKYGNYRVQTVSQEPPRYVAFRWFGGEPARETEPDAPTTLIEFWVEDRPGGVNLKGRERGVQNLFEGGDARRGNFDDNSQGWTQELEAARTFIEAA